MIIRDLKIKIDMDEDLQKLLKETASDLREIKELLKESKGCDSDELREKILNSVNAKKPQPSPDEAKLQELDYLWDTMYSIFSKLQSHYRPTVLSSDSKAVIEREVDESVKKYREEIKQKLYPEGL